MAEYQLVISVVGDGSGVIDLADQIDAVADHANQAGQNISSGLSGINPAAEIVIGAFREIGAVAINALGAAAGAVGGFLKDSVSIAGDFEAGMNQFQAAAGDSLAAAGLSVDDFKNKFLELGATLPVSTSAVQEAATTLIKGGLDPMVVKMGGLESSLKFAAAAGMDLNSAAELSIKNLGTFVPITATAAEQTQFLADSQNLLVKAAGASTLDVDKLGAAMLAAGGQAKASGVDYQDFVTTMGMISPSFDSAATAGTSYKNFLSRLQPTTKSAMDAMTSLNLVTADGKSKFFDATGAFVGNREAAAMLQKSLAGLSDAQRVAALQAIFGNDAMGAAVALANSGAAGYDKFAAAMANASGVEQTAKTVQQGFNIALDNMHGSIEALQIVVGTALLPALTYLLNTVISPGINLVTQFAQAMVSGGDALTGLPPILQSVVGFFESLWNAEGAVEAAFISAGTNSLAFGMALDQLGVALGLPLGLLSGISYAIQGFIAMIYPAADAIGTFFMSMGSGMDVFALTLTLMDVFGATVGGIITDAVVMLRNYAQVWIDLGATIFNVVSALIGGDLAGAWAALTSGIAQVVADYQVYAASLGTLLMSLATTIGQAVLTWGAALVDWIAPYIPIALAALGAFVSAAWTWIQEQAPGWLVTLGSWGMALVDWATPYLSLALTTLSTWVGGLWAWVQEQAPGWLAQLSAWGTALAEWIGPAIPPALAALGELANSAFAWVGEQAAPLLASFSAWASSIVEWIAPATVSFLAAWPGMLSSFLDWIASAAGPILAQLGTWALQFVGWIIPMIPGFIVALGGIAIALAAFIIETAAVLVAKLWQWKQAFVEWMAEVSPMLKPALAQFVTNIKDWIVSAAKALGDAALSIGKSLVDGIRSGISGAWGKLTSWISEQVSKIPAPIRQALGIHSPSQVMADLVGAPIAQGIGAGFSKSMPKVQGVIGSGMAKIVATVTTAAKSLAGTGAPASAGGMLAGLNDFVTEFLATAQSFSMKAVKGAQGFADTVGKILAVIGPAAEALGSLRTLAAPTHESVNAFGAALAYVVGEMIVTTYSFGKKSIAATAVFAENVGKILAPISTAVDAFAKLKDLVTPTHESVNAFRAALQYVLGEMIVTTYSFGPKSIAASAVFAESVGKIMGLIGPAVDAFAKLPDLVVPSHAAVSQFGQTLRTVVAMMRAVSESAKIEFVQAAAVFAESAGKIIAIIGPGVDGFTKLADFGGVPARNITLFGVALRQAVGMLFAIGRAFKAESVVAAAVFAEGAGKAVGMIGAASESMTKLRDFVAPAQATFAAFGASLRTALAALIQVMNGFTADAIAAAGKFGEGAGKAVAFIGSAVDGFIKLKDFVAPSMGAIGSFGVALHATLVILIQTMQSFSAEAVAAAGKFGEGAGKAIALIGSGVESIAKLRDFEAIPQSAILAFEDSLWRAFEEMVQVSEGWTAAAYAQATAFADGAGKAIAMIGTAVDSISKLAEFKAVPQKAILAFADSLWRAFEEMVQISEGWTAAAYEQATAFANGAGKAISLIGTAADGLSKLADFAAPAPKAIAAFGATLKAVLVELGAVAGVFSADAVAITATFATNVNTIVSQVKGALNEFASLEDAKIGGGVLKSFMTSAQNLVAQMSAYLPPNATIIGQNTVVGLINGIVSQRGALITAMVNTVMAAVMAARQTLGIASPSKVFEQIGQYAGAGLQGGMAAMQPAIAATSAGLGISAVNATTSALRPSGGGTTNNNQRNITVNVTVGKDAGPNPYATADAVVTEINRRLGMQRT